MKILVTAAALAVSLLQYAVTPKEYRAATMIQIERKVSVPLQAVQDSWMDNWFNMEYYPTQYRLLTSRGLAERVVLDLGLQADPEFNPGAVARDRRLTELLFIEPGVTNSGDDDLHSLTR